IGIGIDGSRDPTWSIRMQMSTTPSSPQHSMVRIPKATAPALSIPQPYRSSAAKSPVGGTTLFRVQPGEPAKRYTFPYTRVGMAGDHGVVALDFANRGAGTSTSTSRTRELGVGVGIGIGIDASRDSAWGI